MVGWESGVRGSDIFSGSEGVAGLGGCVCPRGCGSFEGAGLPCWDDPVCK